MSINQINNFYPTTGTLVEFSPAPTYTSEQLSSDFITLERIPWFQYLNVTPEELAKKLHPIFQRSLKQHCFTMGTSFPNSIVPILRVKTEVCIELLLDAIRKEDHNKASALVKQLITINPKNAEIYDLLASICNVRCVTYAKEWGESAFRNEPGFSASILQKEKAVIQFKEMLKSCWERQDALTAKLPIVIQETPSQPLNVTDLQLSPIVIQETPSQPLNVTDLQLYQTAIRIDDVVGYDLFLFLSRDLREHLFQQLPFTDFRTARAVCKNWKMIIDELTGIGKGKLTHSQLLEEIQTLVKVCDQNKLIHEKPDDLMKEAERSYSEAIDVYRHLMARIRLLTHPSDYSRLVYDRYVPYVPISRIFFAQLFAQKVAIFPEEMRDQCFTLYPPRTKVNELAVLSHRGRTIRLLYEVMKAVQFDAEKIRTFKIEIPIHFSKDEIEQLKKEALKNRVKNDVLFDQIGSANFFYHQLDRKGAIVKLRGCAPGTFLMRLSSSSNYDAAISYTTKSGEIIHAGFAIIEHEGKPQFFFEGNGLVFESLPKLLEFMSPIWINPLERGKEIGEEERAIWSYIYTLPYYFPECPEKFKKITYINPYGTYELLNQLFLFYDAENKCLKWGVHDGDMVTSSPVDMNGFGLFKTEHLEPIERNEVWHTVFLNRPDTSAPQLLSLPSHSQERPSYESLKM